jgi:hypothetical protein
LKHGFVESAKKWGMLVTICIEGNRLRGVSQCPEEHTALLEETANLPPSGNKAGIRESSGLLKTIQPDLGKVCPFLNHPSEPRMLTSIAKPLLN